MKRRNFNKLAGAFASAPLMLNSIPLKSFASKSLATSLDCSTVQERAIVVVRMAGANDGVNTIIPVGKYDLYASQRPDIRIADTGAGAYVPMDGPTGIDEVGMHPVMTGFRELYENADLGVVQGVSYPQSNRSHFKATDLMLTGSDGRISDIPLSEGWMGRYLESAYPEALNGPIPSLPDPLGLQLGGARLSLGFHTDEEHDVAFNLAGQNPGSIFGVFSGLGGPPPAVFPASEYGEEIEYILGQQNSISVFAERISQLYNSGGNLGSYPETDLAHQFATVARLLNGGIKTKIFLVEIGGFDTHQGQVEAGDTSVGRHAGLLDELSSAIKAFYDDLNAMGLDNRVLTVTFSEFGRKTEQNGNYGCDHGTVGPMFVAGPGARGGVVGGNVNMEELDNGAPATYEHDYRSVFGSLLVDWLGADEGVMASAGFEPYLGENKLDLVEPNLVADVAEAFCNDSSAIGEVQRVAISQPDADTWQRISFIRPYANPIVVMSPVSMNNSEEPAVAKVRNVDATGFECQIGKWENQDPAHEEELVSFMVVEQGEYTLPGGKRLMAGTTTATHRWSTVEFAERFAQPPVVLTQITSENEEVLAVTRQTAIYETDFRLRLRESQIADKKHAEETVHYIAIEEGYHTGEQKFEAVKTGGGVTHEAYEVDFVQNYGINPVLFGAIQSHAQSDTVKLRFDELSGNGVELLLQEETTVDEEIEHNPEDVGYVVFDAPGILSGGAYTPPSDIPPEEEPLPIELKLYPNPFETTFKLEIENAKDPQAKVRLYNEDATRMYLSVTMSTSATMTLNGSGLPSGIYLMIIEVDGEQFTERLIKEY